MDVNLNSSTRLTLVLRQYSKVGVEAEMSTKDRDQKGARSIRQKAEDALAPSNRIYLHLFLFSV